MLQVIEPLTLIACSVHMNVNAMSVSLVVDPVSLVYVSVNVGELALSMRPVVLPVTFVAGSVWPDLRSVAISKAANPLTGVPGARPVSVGLPLLSLCVRVVRRISNGLSQLERGEVTTIGPLGLLKTGYLLPCRVASPDSL